MSLRAKACVAGIFEHPTRHAIGKSAAQLHAECAKGALQDAGLTKDDVDGYFCGGDAHGALSMVEYLNLKVRHVDSTDLGGASALAHVAHAVEAIAAGRCNVALITQAGRPRSEGQRVGVQQLRSGDPNQPELAFEYAYRPIILNNFAMCAARHMHEYGTTSAQLAMIKVSASEHAQHNPNALLRRRISVDEVLASPMLATPLHRMDCCVVTDGGGAVIVTRPEIARSLGRPAIGIIGVGEAIRGQSGGDVDLTRFATQESGAAAFGMAGVKPADIKYASIYDCFTIAVLIQLEDLGFCAKGAGGRFVEEGNLIAGRGSLPFNTDGGGLCSNHPGNRGGITKIIEAVRQARGEAHPALQVKDPSVVLATGIGGQIGRRHGSATLIMERA